MTIPRLHLFELEDQPWFPGPVRDLATDYLEYMQARFELHRPAAELLAEALRATGATTVIDLGSGGGGPVAAISRALRADGLEKTFTLTDRFPNVTAFRRRAAESPGSVGFAGEPVDARAVPASLRGFRTLFNAFHHFRPEDAIAVLRDAAGAGQPIAVFEIPERGLRTLLPMLFLTPLLVLLATPFIRPCTGWRLLWTYGVPLVPLTCWWDGLVSQLRAYTPAELERLALAAGVEGYDWRAGKEQLVCGPGFLTYLVGTPRGAAPPGAGPQTPGPRRDVRHLYLMSDEEPVRAWLEHELAGGLRTWEAVFRNRGYLSRSLDSGEPGTATQRAAPTRTSSAPRRSGSAICKG